MKEFSPYQAQKLLFHYCSRERAMKWVWLFMSVFLFGGISTVFLVDAVNTSLCDRAFDKSATVTTASLDKIKKGRKGGFTWDMHFTTADGKAISGRRNAFLSNEKGDPLTAAPPQVVYAASNPSCWEINMSPEGAPPKIPFAQRWFTKHLNYGFGSFFAVLAVLFTTLSLRRLREKRPYIKELEGII